MVVRSMPNRFDEMELFARVVDAGSFTAAARSLRIPKASATTRLQALEARLGVKLLHRTTRRLSLTTEGAHYYEECTRLLREVHEREAAMSQATARPKGRLRIDVPAASGRNMLAPRMAEFLARYPELVVDVGSSDRAVDLVAEGVDCVIRGGNLHDESLSSRKLQDIPVVTVASPAYLAAHGTPKHPRDLDAHVFVNFFSARTGKTFEVDFERGDEKYSLHVPHRVAANDSDTWLALAAGGCGLLQAPLGAQVRALMKRRQLVPVLKGWSAPPLPVFVLWPQTRRPPARVRAFIDWATEVWAEEGRTAEQFYLQHFKPKG